MESNFEPAEVIGIKRDRPAERPAIRKAAAASQRIIDLSSPTKNTAVSRKR